MMVAYVAHPVGPDGLERVNNLFRVRRWLRWLIDTMPTIALSVPWLPYCEALDETPANRARGTRDGLEMLRRCDAIILVGGRLSSGMAAELAEAEASGMRVLNFLVLGPEPPAPFGIEP